ncbi:carbohydrate ABC transporter permease [Pedococcus sp. 5OH_020]|uniref:carbohydrate ABC transporter permease n=1 Tax=Pedococcus sp. 5OH_020 TaxID=2989814 RepID=UPI0022E9ED3D|nr:sugar ABC transporter permease [Pedococcus sp. 5OH_020]
MTTIITTQRRPTRSRLRVGGDGPGVYSALLAPTFLLLLMITGVPLAVSLWTSLQQWNRGSALAPRFIGLGNFTELAQDPAFWKALGLTAYQVGATVILQLVLGLAIALLLSRSFRGVGLLRSLYLLPMMSTPVVVGLIWKMLLNTDNGMVNYLLGHVGLGPVNWLGSTTWAMPSVVLTDLWLSTPFVVVILVAALQSVPQEVMEAAEVDGASSWQRLVHIVVPIIKPMILLAALFRTMDAIKRFDTIYVMTGGGPGNATETLDLHAFFYAFTYLDVGKGAAVAVVMLALVMVISSVLLRTMRPR